MKVVHVPTYWARIYIAGDIAMIKQVCREHCMEIGLCVTVDPTTYIYTGGEESGAVVGLINYPRFPSDQEAIYARALDLAEKLMERCCQQSYSIVTATDTVWFSRRPEQ
jgi:hypothetical protein